MTTRQNPFAGVTGIKEKRIILSKLSQQAKSIQKEIISELEKQEGDFAIPRVNDILLNLYAGEEKLEWDTFQGWQKKGKYPKKGEKAWVIWSRPKKVEKEITEDVKEEFKLFALCFMFNNKQVK